MKPIDGPQSDTDSCGGGSDGCGPESGSSPRAAGNGFIGRRRHTRGGNDHNSYNSRTSSINSTHEGSAQSPRHSGSVYSAWIRTQNNDQTHKSWRYILTFTARQIFPQFLRLMVRRSTFLYKIKFVYWRILKRWNSEMSGQDLIISGIPLFYAGIAFAPNYHL